MASLENFSLVRALIALLQRDTLRTRIGVWRIPLDYVDREKEMAVRLGIDAVDLRSIFQHTLPDGTRYVHLTAPKIMEALNTIANTSGKTSCVLVHNVDLLLAGLSYQKRQEVWWTVIDGYPHRMRALLLAIPETAKSVLPGEEVRRELEHDNRLI